MKKKLLSAARMLPFVVLIQLLVVTHSSIALVATETGFPIKISVKDFGIYNLIERTEKSFVADSTAGYASVVTAHLIKQTNRIPLKQHVVFGFNYIIEDHSTDAAWVPVEITITHPPTTNYLGHESRGFTKQSAAKKKADGNYHNSAFYLLSEPYELVAGQWSISVSYRNEHQVKIDFVVE